MFFCSDRLYYLTPRSEEGRAIMVGVHLELSSLVSSTTPPFSTLATKEVEEPKSSPITEAVIAENELSLWQILWKNTFSLHND